MSATRRQLLGGVDRLRIDKQFRGYRRRDVGAASHLAKPVKLLA